MRGNLAPESVILTGATLIDGPHFEVQLARYRGQAAVVKAPASAAWASRGELEATLEREHAAARRLKHAGIASIFGLWRLPDGRLGLVREYLPGVTLAENIRTNQVRSGWQGARGWTDATRELLRQVGEALVHAHKKGVVHNDIKPDNVIVGLDPHSGRPKAALIDFGEAHQAARGGTIQYAPPERIEGRPGTRRCDVYGFGVLVYETLSGTVPWDATTTADALVQRRATVDQVPREAARLAWRALPSVVQRALVKALDPDPGRRFRSVRGLMKALTLTGGPAPSPERPRSAGGWPALAAATLGTVVALALLLPVGGGVVSETLLSRPATDTCQAELQARAHDACASASPQARQACEEDLTRLAHPAFCASRLAELTQCEAPPRTTSTFHTRRRVQ